MFKVHENVSGLAYRQQSGVPIHPDSVATIENPLWKNPISFYPTWEPKLRAHNQQSRMPPLNQRCSP